MNTKTLIGLIMLTILAILMDCRAGYVFFLMLAMPTAVYLSPLLFIVVSLSLLILFISSIIGLFQLRKWAYNIFIMLTLIFNSLMSLIYIRDLRRGYNTFTNQLIFLIIFVLIFTLYFLKPSTRKLFDKKKSDLYKGNT